MIFLPMEPSRSVPFTPGHAEFYGALREAGLMNGECNTSWLDSGAVIYDVYECADGKYVSVGPVEQQFYLQLLQFDAYKLGQ